MPICKCHNRQTKPARLLSETIQCCAVSGKMLSTTPAPVLTARRSAMLSTRMPHENIRAFRAYAASKGMTPGAALRMLASSTGDTQDRLLALLGLDGSADIDAILAAVKKAFDTSDPPDGTPLHMGATSGGRGTRQLSESDREGVKRFGSAAAWSAAKRSAVRRA